MQSGKPSCLVFAAEGAFTRAVTSKRDLVGYATLASRQGVQCTFHMTDLYVTRIFQVWPD